MFSERAREAIGCAQREARDMGHGEVQVEHLLLGLFSPESGLDPIWAEFGLAIQPARDRVREHLGAKHGTPPEGQLPFSAAAKDVLRSAYRFPDPKAEHILIASSAAAKAARARSSGSSVPIPHRIRSAAKMLASPFVQGPEGQLRGTIRATPPELDFAD